MSCKTCGHTVQSIGEGRAIFWCPRCGTLMMGWTDGTMNVEPPKLVERVKQFRDLAGNRRGLLPSDTRLWHQLGIAESIALPDDRPQT